MPYLILFIAILAAPLAHAGEILSIFRADMSKLQADFDIPQAIADVNQATVFYALDEDNSPTYYTYLEPEDVGTYLEKYAQSPTLAGLDVTVGDNGLWITKEGLPLTKEQRMEFLAQKEELPQGVIFARIYLAKTIQAVASVLEESQQASVLKAIPDFARLMIEQVDTIELSTQTMSDPLRLVAVIKAQKDSPLAAFLSQRLPTVQEPFMQRTPIEGACVYGYTKHNASALLKYRNALLKALGKDKDINSEMILSIPRSQILNADGINTFFLDENLNPFSGTLGHWNQDSVNTLLQEQAQIARTSQGLFMESNSAFMVDNIPVWSIRVNGQDSSYLALHEGDIYSSSAPVEEFSAFLSQIKEPAQDNVYSAFNHYPTVCAQFIVHPKRLYGAFVKSYPFLGFAKNAVGEQPIYVAASIHRGALGVTLDLPVQNIKLLSKSLTQKALQYFQK